MPFVFKVIQLERDLELNLFKYFFFMLLYSFSGVHVERSGAEGRLEGCRLGGQDRGTGLGEQSSRSA